VYHTIRRGLWIVVRKPFLTYFNEYRYTHTMKPLLRTTSALVQRHPIPFLKSSNVRRTASAVALLAPPAPHGHQRWEDGEFFLPEPTTEASHAEDIAYLQALTRELEGGVDVSGVP
jgi:hypothetical protein